ncbi:MAG: hypothetical protein AVDCRST_MAG18-1735, partial [uncultured Thermomicrobiales bacterium]
AANAAPAGALLAHPRDAIGAVVDAQIRSARRPALAALCPAGCVRARHHHRRAGGRESRRLPLCAAHDIAVAARCRGASAPHRRPRRRV